MTNHSNPSRRSFLQSASAAGALSLLGPIANLGFAQSAPSMEAILARVSRANTVIPPLFCVAYVTPDAPGQGGQEATVARYPLALVPQDNRDIFRRWRDQVRSVNPAIWLLGYQVVIEETGVPGPGHDVMRGLQDAWCVYPGGSVPTVGVSPSPHKFRIFDPRHPRFGPTLIGACESVLASYPFQGLLLDQCTVYVRAHPIPSVREEMRLALGEVMVELRRRLPNAILIGNSSYKWAGLNGELNEARPAQVSAETVPFSGHTRPQMSLVLSHIKTPTDLDTVRREMSVASTNGVYYGASLGSDASVDYQHVFWCELFDEVMQHYARS